MIGLTPYRGEVFDFASVRRAVGLGGLVAVSLGRATARGVRARCRRRGTISVEMLAALPGTIEQLGPAFIKFAQIASTRHDALPPGVCRVLSQLHSTVTPVGARAFRDAVSASYGGRTHEVFRSIDEEAIGSGSIACVYRAVLVDGTPVALKVRRPGVEDLVRRDVRLIQGVIDVLARLPTLRGVPLSEMGRAVGDAVIGQLDFAAEATDLAVLGDSFAALEAVTVPRVLSEQSRPDCLVMSLVDVQQGWALEDISPRRRELLARQTLQAVFDMLFRTGVVHCDLHPGNLVLIGGEEIGIIDAGFVCRVPAHVRRQLALFFLNLGFRNGPACAQAVVGSAAALGADADLVGFEASMCDIVDRFGSVPARDFDLIAFSVELFGAQQRHGIYASSEFVFPLLSLLMVEGLVRRLDPELDFQALARPVVYYVAAGRPVPVAGDRPSCG